MPATPTAFAPASGSIASGAPASPISPPASATIRPAAAPPIVRSRNGWRRSSAFDHIDREAALRGLLVALVHVEAGPAHRLDHLVERDAVGAVADQSETARLDRLDRADRVAL